MSKLGAMKRTLLLFVALIFAILLRPQPSFGQNYVTTGDDRKAAGELIRGLMDSGKSGSTAELMTEAALKLLGTPYESGTLDEDPSSEKLRIYLTRTDCILFVETCLNLALTVKASEDGAYPTFEDFAANVARSRYRVDPPYSYSDRVHYTTEWIRRQEGILRDVTLDLGGEEYDHPIHFMSRHPESYKQLSTNSANPRAAMDLERIKGVEKDLIVPIEKFGVKWMSVGYFAKPEQALIWRGPMACGALKQLTYEVLWGDLDYLLIDLPPGTGDIHITMVQEIPLTGAIIVTPPQKIALADVEKGINMFRSDKVNTPILGIVENMSWFTPKELPDNKYYIFGQGGGQMMAEKYDVPLLGQVPLVMGIMEGGDNGEPAALSDENVKAAFSAIAEAII